MRYAMTVDDYHPPTNLATEAWSGTVARYVAVAGLVVLLYDHILTMNEEVSAYRFPRDSIHI